MPLMRKAPEKLFSKEIISKGYGFHTPQYDSVCKIKVVSDEANLLSGLCEDQTKEIIIGNIDEQNYQIIEDCIRTMKEKEECRIIFRHHDADIDIPSVGLEIAKKEADHIIEECFKNVKDLISLNKSESVPNSELQSISSMEVEAACISKSDEPVDSTCSNSLSDLVGNTASEINEHSCVNKKIPLLVKIQFQLLSFTREPEIWEMTITEKYNNAQYHRVKGRELYVCEMHSFAFKQFALALKYAISLEQDPSSIQEAGIDLKGFKISCYLNIAACQLKHGSFENVVVNTSKALNLQPNNAKALYRRGVAYLQLQEYEKAKEDLTAAQQLLPKDQAIAKQLQIHKYRVKKLNQYYASAMRKMFS